MKGCLSKLINPAQTSFVPDRHIADNILIAQEVVHQMQQKRGGKLVALKIDLKKSL